MKSCLKSLTIITCLVLLMSSAEAGWGIKGIYVFGDSLSDSGNAGELDETLFGEEEGDLFPVPPYYPGRASNGPVWVEIAAEAYGMEVEPHLLGGRNFAYIGAESGEGMSDQGTPNFLEQVALFKTALAEKEIKNVHPKDLFIIWVGINDFQRILAEGGEITEASVEEILANIEEGILALHDERARLFLVPNLPAVYLSPLGMGGGGATEEQITSYNEALEELLAGLEEDPQITIYRLDTQALLEAIHEDPESYGLDNVTDPLVFNLPAPVEEQAEAEVPDEEGEKETQTDYGYLYWDDFHPTVEGHALIAQFAMNEIPIGSWWGRSVGRGPGGAAYLGMGWVEDNYWPWLYVYNMTEDGEWMWVHEESGDLEGFFSFLPSSIKWIWINAMSGWYYDYSTGEWEKIELPEDPENGEEEGPGEG